MRTLFCCLPLEGHFQPVLPLATALVARGHEVAFATGDDLRTAIEARGFALHPAGPSMFEIGFEMERRGLDLSPESQRMTMQRYGQTEIRLATVLPDLMRVIERWRPDVLVHDLAEYGAAPAATAAGLPHATVAFGPRLADDYLAAVVAGITPHWRMLGLEPPCDGGLYTNLYFDPVPPMLQPTGAARPDTVHPIRPSLGPEAGELPAEIEALGRRLPLVYATFGTVYGAFGLQAFVVALDALEAMNVDVVVTTGSAAPEMLGARHDRMVLRSFIPQLPILERASVVVSHGGAGPVFGALSLGVPLVILPQGADHFDNARSVVAAGAGRCLLPSEVSAGAVRDAVDDVLATPSYRERATVIRREIMAMPGAESAALLVEQLARRTRP